jgi:VCBS repeat-containing protein
MSLSVTSLAKRLFRRFTKKAPTPSLNRFRPMLEACEDRTTPTPVVSIAAQSNTAEGGWVSYQLARTETSGFLMVNVSFSGTASSGDFYDPMFASFMDGQATATLNVNTVNDSDSEPTETLIAAVATGSGYTIGSPSSATVNIYDNDAQVVSVASADTASEGGDTGHFLFFRTGDLSGALTVNYTVGGTATSGTDYTSIGTTVTFTANSATAMKVVTALADQVTDGGETVLATVGTGTGYSVGSPSSGTVYINDNTPPVATDDEFEGDEDDEIEDDVLANDTDVNGNTLTATVGDGPWFGTLDLNPDGTFIYTPDEDFFGTDWFTYEVSDGNYGTDTGTVTLTVAAVGDDPLIENQTFAIEENLPNGVIVGTVQASDPDYGQVLTFSITAGNTSGAFSINAESGTISVANSAALDHETTAQFTLTVQVTDNGTTPRSETASVTIDSTDADEGALTPAQRTAVLNARYTDITGSLYGGWVEFGSGNGNPIYTPGLDRDNEDSWGSSVAGFLDDGFQPDFDEYFPDMHELSAAMITALTNENFEAYQFLQDEYLTLLLNLDADFFFIRKNADEALAEATGAVVESEKDAFRIKGIARLLSDLNADLSGLKELIGAETEKLGDMVPLLAEIDIFLPTSDGARGAFELDLLQRTLELNERIDQIDFVLGLVTELDDPDPEDENADDPGGANDILFLNGLSDDIDTLAANLNPNAFGSALDIVLDRTHFLFTQGAGMLNNVANSANFFDYKHDYLDALFGDEPAVSSLVGDFDLEEPDYGLLTPVFLDTDAFLLKVDDEEDSGALDVTIDIGTALEVKDKFRLVGIGSDLERLSASLVELRTQIDALGGQMESVVGGLVGAGNGHWLTEDEAIFDAYTQVLAAIDARLTLVSARGTVVQNNLA